MKEKTNDLPSHAVRARCFFFGPKQIASAKRAAVKLARAAHT